MVICAAVLGRVSASVNATRFPHPLVPPAGTPYQNGVNREQRLPPAGTPYQNGVNREQRLPPAGTPYQKGVNREQRLPLRELHTSTEHTACSGRTSSQPLRCQP